MSKKKGIIGRGITFVNDANEDVKGKVLDKVLTHATPEGSETEIQVTGYLVEDDTRTARVILATQIKNVL